MLTLLGDLGPWRERIYLAGGLAPRYIVGHLPEGASPHVGTTDVDLIIGLALGDDAPDTYRTLQDNLVKAKFRQNEPSFRWSREVDGVEVLVEFLCETDSVAPGRIFSPKGESTGSRVSAFNVRGAQLVREDFVEVEIDGERLDDGGHSSVVVRVANVLPYAVLKTLAFQDRHENKDAYDLVFTLLNYGEGPQEAGRAASLSPVVNNEQVCEALTLMEARFKDTSQDGPHSYAGFLGVPGDDDELARLRLQAVMTVQSFLGGLRKTP